MNIANGCVVDVEVDLRGGERKCGSVFFLLQCLPLFVSAVMKKSIQQQIKIR
jgi:hypothetical protein